MSPAKTKLESGTTALTEQRCFAIFFIEATTFTTCDGITGDSLSGVTFPAGATIFGNFNNVTLASGKVLLYCNPAG